MGTSQKSSRKQLRKKDTGSAATNEIREVRKTLSELGDGGRIKTPNVDVKMGKKKVGLKNKLLLFIQDHIFKFLLLALLIIVFFVWFGVWLSYKFGIKPDQIWILFKKMLNLI